MPRKGELLRGCKDAQPEETADTIMQRLRSSTVVKYSPKMDLTQKIIVRLNEDYEKAK